LLCAGPAHSATDASLTAADAIAVNKAVARYDLPAIYKVIFAAIAGAPEQAPAIVDEAARLAPNHREAIVNTASAAFPEYADRFAAAGGEAATEEDEVAVERRGRDRRSLSDRQQSAGYDQRLRKTDLTARKRGEPVRLVLQLRQRQRRDDNPPVCRPGLDQLHPFRALVCQFRLRFVDVKDDGFQWQIHELVGPGCRIFNTDKLKLSVEAGPGLRQARERSADGGSVNNDLVGWFATDLAWKITEGSKFTNNFGGWGNAKRVQLDNVTALTLKIVDDFSARLSYEVRHDTDPGDDADKTDTTAKGSLVYGFGGGSK
jgi:hypothetical protein